MRITHEIYKTKLSIGVSLDVLELQIPATRKKTPFDLLSWREFGGCCLIYKSGKIICHGNAVIAYCQQLQNLGYNTKTIRIVTRSATHTLYNPVNYRILVKLGFLWFPELFHAPRVKKK